MKKKELKLDFIWNLRLKLYAEGDKLCAEGDKLCAEGDKLCAEGDKLYAEGDKLWAEGSKLRAEGDKLWAESILEVYGNIKLEWIWNDKTHGNDCKLETGEFFRYKKVKV